ncbi:MAG TPA: response regulator transcription factor [Verrucomicrobiales bacterium]|nr:response regulator transcription factor [Verrucomicrobiales bacterium]
MPDTSPHDILVIDDDRKLCRLISDYLEPLGYRITSAHNGPDGVASATEGPWHAIILDYMLPGMDGLEVLRRIRQHCGAPVLMFTARGDEADRIVGLEMGADDYLPKTFSPRELLARLRAVTRRTGGTAKNTQAPVQEIVIGPLRICGDNRSAVLDDQPLILTPVEFDLLLSLAKACGRVKSREHLVDEIRDRDFDVFDRSVDVHISALRRKLGDDPKNPRFIRTLRSAGYMLVNPKV